MAGSERADFEYDGRLVFNGIRETKVSSNNLEEMREELLFDLPEFERGSPNNKKRGFEEIDLSGIAEAQNETSIDGPILDEDLTELAENIVDRKYIWESYAGTGDNVEFVNEEGDRTSAWIRSTDEAYVYWAYPDFMFIQGAQTRVEETEGRINAALGEDADVTDVSFDPDYLLWLLYRHDYADDGIPGAISIDQLNSSEVQGDLEQYGHRGRVEDSTNIGESLPIIAALLQEMDFRMMEGWFSLNGYSLKAEIQTTSRQVESSRIHIKVEGAIDDAETYLKRALLGLMFVREFTDLYQEWRDEMDDMDKYPPFKFFDDLAGTAASNNVDLNFDVDDLIEEYEEKRGERADSTEFDHL